MEFFGTAISSAALLLLDDGGVFRLQSFAIPSLGVS
jgi:hypothetical protein